VETRHTEKAKEMKEKTLNSRLISFLYFFLSSKHILPGCCCWLARFPSKQASEFVMEVEFFLLYAQYT
jgi:hypothetical protein